ncbi:hypothetical protein BJX62DRAFT_195071 [Aspergillus germanicus]
MALGAPYTIPPPPAAYEHYLPLMNTCTMITGLCWVACYLGQAHHSMTHRTYSMPFFAQASNLAWEFVYGGLIYPSPLALERLIFLSGFATNTILQYTAIRYGRAEWVHAPLVSRNLEALYAVTIAVFVAGNLAAAEQFGPHIGGYYVAILAQLIISVGSLAQLLSRGATRGFSLWLWTFRHVGSILAAPCFYIRAVYWPEAFGFLMDPVMLWMGGISYLAELAYGLLFWWIQRQEEERESRKSK